MNKQKSLKHCRPRYKPWLATILLASVISTINYAQTDINSGGSTEVQEDGSVSYSLGTSIVAIGEGTNCCISPCPQVAYEVQEISNLENAGYLVDLIKIYPNPTADYLQVKIKTLSPKQREGLHLTLFDETGRLLISEDFTSDIYQIEMSEYSKGIFILKITNNNQEITSFKILKN